MANFKNNSSEQGMFIAVSFKEQIIPGTIEHAIFDIVENYIDTSSLEKRYNNDVTGCKAYSPKNMIKIILLAYSNGIMFSRGIESACKKNIQFMAMSGCAQPDHSTIAAFISSMDEEVLNIFTSILLRCAQLDLIGGEVFAIDGCKISSNASKEFSGTFKELERKKEKLKTVIENLTKRHRQNDTLTEDGFKKKKKKYKNTIKKIDDFINSNEPKIGKRNRELKSNITDNESGKIKSNTGYVQGYNGIAIVDDKKQVIVNAEAFGSNNEGQFLKTMIENTNEQLEEVGFEEGLTEKQFVADTNYFSEENCELLEKEEIEGYIPDQQFRNRDPRFPDKNTRRKKKNLFDKNDFTYNEENNSYTCPADKTLKYCGTVNNHGNFGRRYKADKNDCHYCHLKSKCLQKNAKVRCFSITDIPKPKTYSEKMMEKIDTLHGRDMYSKRMGIVEPVFANIKIHKRLDYFTLRGKKKVNAQWLLYCCVHNIGKIANSIGEKLNSFIFGVYFLKKYYFSSLTTVCRQFTF